jgi:hypothetical protein
MFILVLGLILLLVGVCLRALVADAFAQTAGTILAAVGLILVVVALLLLLLGSADGADIDVKEGVVLLGRRWF